MMMETNNFTQVNQIVYLMRKYDPNEYGILKERYPDFEDLFEGGALLGTPSQRLIEVKIEICEKGLALVQSQLGKFIPRLRKKLIFLRRVQLTSNVISLIGGLAIIFLFDQKPVYLKYLIGTPITIGGIGSLFLKPFLGSSFFGIRNWVKIYDELVDKQNKANTLLQKVSLLKVSQIEELKLKSRIRGVEETISELINHSNKIGEETLELISEIDA